jgi:hypothetical protein
VSGPATNNRPVSWCHNTSAHPSGTTRVDPLASAVLRDQVQANSGCLVRRSV